MLDQLILGGKLEGQINRVRPKRHQKRMRRIGLGGCLVENYTGMDITCLAPAPGSLFVRVFGCPVTSDVIITYHCSA